MALKVGSESPAIRIKRLDGTDNVIGSMSNGIQVIYNPKNLSDAKEAIKLFEAQESSKMLPVILLKEIPNEQLSAQKTVIAIDDNGDFEKRYGEGESLHAIDDEGIVVYGGEADFLVCFESIAPLLVEKNKKHHHEDWMRPQKVR